MGTWLVSHGRLTGGGFVAVLSASLVCGCFPVLFSGNIFAQEFRSSATSAPEVTQYDSRHFRVFSDTTDPAGLLMEMEDTLKVLSKYWGKKPFQLPGQPKTISCYIINDVKNWPKDLRDWPHNLPDAHVKVHLRLASLSNQKLVKIVSGADSTVGLAVHGKIGWREPMLIYAIDKASVARHEVVHAYCRSTFRNQGDGHAWFDEGIAEDMGSYWGENGKRVNAPAMICLFLRKEKSNRPKLYDVAARDGRPCADWMDYARSWALCHFLRNNPNYNATFRLLGLSYLTGEYHLPQSGRRRSNRKPSLELAYKAEFKQLAFEYDLFLNNIERGVQVDVCSWDWNVPFAALTDPAVVVVKARRGWQPTGVLVVKGTTYSYDAKGAWKLGPGKPALSANGDQNNGRGQLVCTVIDPSLIGSIDEETELGTKGDLTASSAGQLYVRCRDKWGELSDNSGQVTLTIQPHR